MKRILIISRATVHHFKSGGMETHLKVLAEGLSFKNKVTVISTAQSLDNKEDLRIVENNVEYVFLANTTPGLNPLFITERLFFKLGLMKRSSLGEGTRNFYEVVARYIGNLLKSESIDIIFSQSTSGRGLVGLQNLGLTKNLPPIVTIIHGVTVGEIKNRLSSLSGVKSWIRFFAIDYLKSQVEKFFSDKKFFDLSTKIIAVSEALKKDFLSIYPEFTSKIVVINNGVDVDLFNSDKLAFIADQELKNEINLLYVGRMDKEKGVDLMIRAISILNKNDCNNLKNLIYNLTLVGDGQHIVEFRNLVNSLDVGSHVKFSGSVDNFELPKIYSAADLFIFPTRREEGHPMTISEAFCMGLPVIATRKGGLKDLIEDGFNGIFIEDENPEDLAKKIHLVSNNKKLLESLSRNAYSIGRSKYTKKVMIKKYEDVVFSFDSDNIE